jgi:hypothetical protein
MTKLPKYLVLFAICFAPTMAGAAELSPWLGNDGQAPFQLDPHTMVAVTFAADPLQTGSTTKPHCNLQTCTLQPNTAKDNPQQD